MIAKRPTESSSGQAPHQPGAIAANAGGAGLSLTVGTIPTLGVSSSVGGSAHQGPPVFLRICVPEDTDAVLRYTTINVFVSFISLSQVVSYCLKSSQNRGLVHG
jgi:hypothetical protein